ncbi:hypothetical protein J3R82DRAFT_1614 [Butyriboletus roseoflavus]|nr:hypothetical protein J3R82DRAFT_1614 [Butyriboletus roseoflavus]
MDVLVHIKWGIVLRSAFIRQAAISLSHPEDRMRFEATFSSKGVALVTGSGSGIGRTIALRLASDGYDIALNDLAVNKHSLDAIREEINNEYPVRRVSVLPADVSIEEEVKNMVDGAVEALDRLDVMVANAGILRTGSISQATVDDLDAVLAVNVRGTFLCYKYAAQKMIDQGTKGRMIGASSLAGKEGQCGVFSLFHVYSVLNLDSISL